LRVLIALVDEGGILAFRPLILHASAPASVPGHRRVLHIEFDASELAPPLEWETILCWEAGSVPSIAGSTPIRSISIDYQRSSVAAQDATRADGMPSVSFSGWGGAML
jgi:hypothetical protein